MRRFLLYLSTAQLTFSIGDFLHVYANRVEHNIGVIAAEAKKREHTERPEVMYSYRNKKGRLTFWEISNRHLNPLNF